MPVQPPARRQPSPTKRERQSAIEDVDRRRRDRQSPPAWDGGAIDTAG